MAAPKNAKLNLPYKRLIDYCQKNKITVTNLSTIHLSAIAILTGPCITSGCSNNFEKRYGELLTTNGYCSKCIDSKKTNKNIDVTSKEETNKNTQIMSKEETNKKIDVKNKEEIKEISKNIDVKNKEEINKNTQIMSKEKINEYIKNHKNYTKMFPLTDVKTDYSILICGGFKTGTVTLHNTFLFPRTHSLFLSDLKNEDTIFKLIVLFRDNDSVYKSAFFQDILISGYTYSPFAKGNFLQEHTDLSEKEKQILINKINVKELIQHYNKINWDKYIHLNNKNRLAILNSYYHIQINYNSRELQVFRIETENNKTLHIIALHTDTINNNFDELKREIYGSSRPDIVLKNSNIGSKKWYSSKYKEFLDNIDRVKIVKNI